MIRLGQFDDVGTSYRWTPPSRRAPKTAKSLKSHTFTWWTASCFIAEQMLITIAVVLCVLWVLGFVTSTTMGGFLHLLLVFAVIVVLIRVIQGKRIIE